MPQTLDELAGQRCPICETGRFLLVQIDHQEQMAEGNPITVPGVWVDLCDHCGELVFPGETVQFIESFIAEQSEPIDAVGERKAQ